MADDKVQPVPWVFGLSIRFPANQRPFPSLQSRSLASFNLCPPLHSTAQLYVSEIFFAAASISATDVIFIPVSSSVSGIFGVRIFASGNNSAFKVSIASSLISLAPLVATMTGSTTTFFASYCFNFAAIMQISSLSDTIPIFTASG